MHVPSDVLVRALCRAGFVIYRSGPEATILERGLRAIVVPTRTDLQGTTLTDLRRMSGLGYRELDALLADLERHPEHRA